MLTDSVRAYFGGAKGWQTRAAKMLGIRPAAVSQWNHVVPPLRARQLEELTGGVLSFDSGDYVNHYKPKKNEP